MPEIKKAQKKRKKEKTLAPHKLLMLVTIVARNKAEFYEDYILGFEANACFSLSAFGTAPMSFGMTDINKAVIISVIRDDMEKTVLEGLEEKFKSVRGGKGVAFTVPLTSTIGVLIYQFLSNKGKEKENGI